MAKYRIVRVTIPLSGNTVNRVLYQVEKKFLWGWDIISLPDSFKTLDEALEFIKGNCKDPSEPKREVLQYIEIKKKKIFNWGGLEIK